jgi:pimeloyl-ACP methyl ester carboxylesterase
VTASGGKSHSAAGGSAGEEPGVPLGGSESTDPDSDGRVAPEPPFVPHCEIYFREQLEGQGGAPNDNCGCLVVDESWSCSKDTCPDDDGLVRTLAPEAGLLEIPARDFFQETVARRSPEHRVFYSFHPAERDPEQKPLLVFFNGGPGSATMTYLFAQTGPKTLLEDGVSDNPASYARDFNLLYIDAPFTGFSYSQAEGFEWVEDREAGIVIEVVLGFLARHPLLERNPVAFVGESYGGTRALLMAERLLYYPQLADPKVKAPQHPAESAVYFDLGLYELIQEHFARTRPELGGAELTPEQVTEQFGRLVLIQPGLPRPRISVSDRPCIGSHCESLKLGPCTTKGRYDCSLPPDSDEKYDEFVIPKLENPETLSQALGVDARSIEWLRFCEPEDSSSRERVYFLPKAPLKLPDDRPEPVGAWDRARMYQTFLRATLHQRTLMTNARQDRVIQTPVFWSVLHASLPASDILRVLSDIPEGAPRPGEVEFTIQGNTTRIRYPSYLAGHMVPLRAGAELYEDILEWWSD